MNERTETFLRLTPDHVLRAVELAGLEPTGHIQALHCFENRVFDLRLEDDTHVVAKFYRPGRWSAAAIDEEHTFLSDLCEAEIPVAVPLPVDGDRTLGQVQGIFYAIWPRVGGRSPDELDDGQVEILGRLVARMHDVGAARPAQCRGVLDETSQGVEPLRYLEQNGVLPTAWRDRYFRAASAAARTYRERARGVPLHRIHGDCHLGNLLVGREGAFFVDFDDFMMGPAVQDIWMLVPGRDAEAERQRGVLVDAYRQFRTFHEDWLRLVEPLRALRFVRYAAWIARRWEDPAFPASFPHFGSERYWERETLDLEAQLARIESE